MRGKSNHLLPRLSEWLTNLRIFDAPKTILNDGGDGEEAEDESGRLKAFEDGLKSQKNLILELKFSRVKAEKELVLSSSLKV